MSDTTTEEEDAILNQGMTSEEEDKLVSGGLCFVKVIQNNSGERSKANAKFIKGLEAGVYMAGSLQLGDKFRARVYDSRPRATKFVNNRPVADSYVPGSKEWEEIARTKKVQGTSFKIGLEALVFLQDQDRLGIMAFQNTSAPAFPAAKATRGKICEFSLVPGTGANKENFVPVAKLAENQDGPEPKADDLLQARRRFNSYKLEKAAKPAPAGAPES